MLGSAAMGLIEPWTTCQAQSMLVRARRPSGHRNPQARIDQSDQGILGPLFFFLSMLLCPRRLAPGTWSTVPPLGSLSATRTIRPPCIYDASLTRNRRATRSTCRNFVIFSLNLSEPKARQDAMEKRGEYRPPDQNKFS